MESLNIKTDISLKKLLQLERSGRYDEAIQELDDIWQDKGSMPNVENFDKRTAANIILRCGSLIGFLGHSKHIPGSQEKSKNLITEAHKRFLEFYDIEKIAECENYLALAYWRTGELVDAEVWLGYALTHNLPNSSDVRLFSYLVRSMLTNSSKKHKKTISDFKQIEDDYRKYGDDFLNGTISSNIGIAYRNLGDSFRAIKYFELAREYHRKSKHKVYLGTTENNISLLYKSVRKFREAHQAIDSATRLFKKINDITRYGFSFDTKALIYIDEGKYEQALNKVEEAVNILKSSENANYLVETLSTKIKILVSLNQMPDAYLCLSEAIHIANSKIGEKKARKIAEEFADIESNKNYPVVTKIYTEKELGEENIELVLPPEISHYKEIQGVWIKNKHLEKLGLKKGSLAIIANETVEKGDLTAVIESETQDVSCGIYDSDFGIICLDRLGGEPQLFNEDEIQILGKIIGVAESTENEENKMYVEPTNITK